MSETTPLPADLVYPALSDEQLGDLLFTEEDRLPRAAVDEFLRRGERMASLLVAILDDSATWEGDGPNGWALVHAFYILAAMRTPGTFDALVRAMRKAEETELEWISDLAGDILGSFGIAAVPALKSIVLDRADVDHVRWTAIDGLSHVADDNREAATEIAAVFRAVASDEADDPGVREFAAMFLLDLATPEDRPLLLSLAGGISFRKEEVERAVRGERCRGTPSRDWLEFYDNEQIRKRQERWRQEAERESSADGTVDKENDYLDDEDYDLESAVDSNAMTFVRDSPKVGRNDPCPCGSGKKYKKCCGQ